MKKNNLAAMAKKLSEQEIQELIRLKKQDDKKLVALRRKRDRLAAKLDELDREIAAYDPGAATGRKRAGRPRKNAAAPRKTRSRTTNLSAAVRQVFTTAGTPLKAAQVVEALPEAGVKVKNETDMKKRVSVVLASQKKYFEQVERGVYQLKDAQA